MKTAPLRVLEKQQWTSLVLYRRVYLTTTSVSFGRGLSHKHQAPVWIFNVEFGHPIFPVKQIADSIAVLESFHMPPQSIDARNLHVYLGMAAHTIHDLLGCGPLKVDGLAVPFHYRILRRLHGCCESKHALVKRNRFLHIGRRQHGTDSFRYRSAQGASNRRILSSVAGGADPPRRTFYVGDPEVRATRYVRHLSRLAHTY